MNGSQKTRESLKEMLGTMQQSCTKCGLCKRDCAFLTEYGTPGEIAENYDPTKEQWMKIPFACSLCGLCRAVCPLGLAPDTLIREMRRQSVDNGFAPFAEHKGPLSFERVGMSSFLIWHGLPEGCTRVLFPGCAFPGTRPQRTKELFALLQKDDPCLGLVLDCCGRISSDLGRESFAKERIHNLAKNLVSQGVREIVLICPSCFDMFHGLHPQLSVRMIYDLLPPSKKTSSEHNTKITLHDPCALRFQTGVHDCVRSLLQESRIEIHEPTHARLRTVCCGMGAGIKAFAPNTAEKWLDIVARDAGEHILATYCAGCTQRIGERVPAVHVLDVLCDPESALKQKGQQARGLRTYLNRFMLKRYFRKIIKS